MPQQQIKLQGLGMFGAAIIWGTWVLILSDITLPGFFVTAITSFTGFLALLIFIFITRKQKLFFSVLKLPNLMKTIAAVALLEAIQNAFFMAALMLAIKDGGSIFIPIIRSFIGIIMPIVTVLFAKKDFSLRFLLFGAVSTIGAILIFSWNGLNAGDRISYLSLSLVIASQIFSAIQYIAQKSMTIKMIAVKQQESVVITYQILLTAVFLTPLIIGYSILNTSIIASSSFPVQIIYIGFFGLTHVALAFILRLKALKHITASQAVIIGYLEPITSVALSILFLKEIINFGFIIGAILILGSAIAAGLHSTSSKQSG